MGKPPHLAEEGCERLGGGRREYKTGSPKGLLFHDAGVQVAERAGISLSTLSKPESGGPGVTLDTLVKVMFVLGRRDEVAGIAAVIL